jgi:hypothetical protein
VVHCCPEGTPENVFRELAFPNEEFTPFRSDQLLVKGGWVAFYGPYLADDGSYKSKGDEEVRYSLQSAIANSASSITRISKLKTPD